MGSAQAETTASGAHYKGLIKHESRIPRYFNHLHEADEPSRCQRIASFLLH